VYNTAEKRHSEGQVTHFSEVFRKIAKCQAAVFSGVSRKFASNNTALIHTTKLHICLLCAWP